MTMMLLASPGSDSRSIREVAERLFSGLSIIARSIVFTHTHALSPQPNQLWLIRSPRAWQDGVQGTGHTLDDTESTDIGRHEADRNGSERDGGYMSDGNH